MDIDAIKKKAKESAESDYGNIETEDINEPLVAVKPTDRIIIEPIWVKPVDDFEGPLMAQYIESHPEYSEIYLRKTVAEMLDTASRALPSQFNMVVRAGHRPVEVQRLLLKALIDRYQREHSGASYDDALEFARTYVSDPFIKIPPHCCGTAVDIDVLDSKSEELVDFGCPVNTDSEKAFLFSDLVTDKQKENRMMLLEAMQSVGFACNYNEWWHYSYGSQAWASFYDQPKALYDLIDYP